MSTKILSGQELVDTLRQHCDNAKERIWIASPYIGNIKDVQKIIGNNWKESHMDFRVLTDIESGFIRPDTYQNFTCSPNTAIRSLLSLHAKIYLADDWCLLTSANLTGMAFSARYEIGQEIAENDVQSVTELFESWWEKADPIQSYTQSISYSKISEIEDSPSYKKKYKLPPSPSETNQEVATLANHSGIAVKISKSISERKELYEATRKAWKLSLDRANRDGRYLLAIDSGKVQEVYIGEWKPSIDYPDRIEFSGEPAPENIRVRYRGKPYPKCYQIKGSQNPARYIDLRKFE